MNKQPRDTRHLREASNIKGRDPQTNQQTESESEEIVAIKEAHETLKIKLYLLSFER